MRFEFGEHLLDVERHELWRGGAAVALEPQVFDLLVYLLRNRERVVSRDDLIAGVWGGRIVSDSAVTTRINAARKAVGDSGATQAVIRTVARKGVRFVAEVREHHPTAAAPPSGASRPAREAARAAGAERMLATILFIDIVESTKKVAQLGDREWRRLLSRFDAAVRGELALFRGSEIRHLGDGFLATFDSPERAVRCALGAAEAVAPLGMAVRSGLHTGEIVQHGSDISGIAVHIAARIVTLAQPGETFVSRTVRDLVTGSGLLFDDRGLHTLKGVPEAIQLYACRAEGAGIAAPSALPPPPQSTQPLPLLLPAGEAPPDNRPAILVLPFRNLSGDPQQDYLTDAVTSDLTVDLSRMRDLVVISAATALTYKAAPFDLPQIARELGVRYLLMGSIGRSGDIVRTNVQLIEAASGQQLWGDRFEHAFVDLGGLENIITGRIAASLNVQLVRAEGRRAERAPQPDALDLRLRATALFYGSIAPEHTLVVRRLLQRSLELDPGSAEAWARLAQVIAGDHLNHWNEVGKDELAVAAEAVHQALLTDPSLALAHVAHGLIERARGRHHSALEAFSRAVELDRNFAFAYAHQGNELILVGRPAEAPPLVDQAIRLSPHDPSIGIFYWIGGRAHFYAEQYDAAIPWLRRSIQARPNIWYNRLYLISAYAHVDRLDEAQRAMDEFNDRFPRPRCTLATVRVREESNPNDYPSVVAARQRFHQGLARAGMADR